MTSSVLPLTSLCRRALCTSSSSAAFLDCGSVPPAGIRVLSDFISPAEELALLSVVEPALSRRRYEAGHWDTVIAHYREVQRDARALAASGEGAVARVLERVAAACGAGREWLGREGPPAGGSAGREFLREMPPSVESAGRTPPLRRLLPDLHILDLAAEGRIDAHVDSIKFSGGMVAGLCLLSDAVMSLRRESPQPAPLEEVRLLLPRGCFYMLTGDARYAWAHAVLPGPQRFRGGEVVKGRRVSIMFRDLLEEDSGGTG